MFCQIWLTCKDDEEANQIANTLLVKHLVACVKRIPITSDFQWQGKIEQSKEILLVMDSREDLFKQVETEVAKIHSYDTHVLQSVPIVNISEAATKWLNKELLGE